ncbi:hypothetical protein EUZ85_09265 [Hahella sp. KA22]|uniref:HAD family hydrolase n=1 Tax=Hahella sp. KA22 TaxID=1628392 RepID=UPI000FDD0A7F|nr:HAD-IA family hydrolase [Hahella sp. KA22]AZZ90899.1 hypothetical protein ENC22_06710 [Hahella sp. KA22]QAY54269.1 hypothetical protein EUZ85_09265 [Hahella sp. KA22]
MNEDKEVKVYSFDIFDTCISRRQHQPYDLFIELSYNMESNGSHLLHDLNFPKLRHQAEQSARMNSNRQDVLLDDIYEEMLKKINDRSLLDEIKGKEIELEITSAHPIRPTLDRFHKLRAEGARVIFISDMYLPKDVLSAILLKCGYNIQGVPIYSSGEVGLTKRSGALFQHILKKESIEANELCHIGDNILSDIKVPRSQGVNTVHVEESRLARRYINILQHKTSCLDLLTDLLQRKSKLYRKLYKHPLDKLNIQNRLALSTSLGASRLVSHSSELNGPLQIISSYISAPLLNSFVSWLINQAQQDDIKRLYFVARNAQIFYKIAKGIFKDSNIECHYIYGSRAAWYPASFSTLDEEFTQLILNKYPNRSMQQILSDLSIPEDYCRKILDKLESKHQKLITTTNKENVKKLLTFLAESEESTLLLNHFASQRAYINEYLSTMGVFEPGNIAIVDIGWHLSSHNALYKIVKDNKKDALVGYYFGVGKKHPQTLAPFKAFITNEGAPEYNWLFKLGPMTLLEEVFCAADHGSTKCYEYKNSRVEPKLKETHNSDYTIYIDKLQEDAHRYSKLFSLEQFSQLYLIREEAIETFELFYKFPKRLEALSICESRIFALTSHDASQERVLAHPLSFPELIKVFFAALLLNRQISPKWTWFQGSTSISRPLVAFVGRILSRIESTSSKIEKKSKPPLS